MRSIYYFWALWLRGYAFSLEYESYLGSLKVSVYIYAVPTVGVSAACMLLGESINFCIIIGGILTLFVIFLSQK